MIKIKSLNVFLQYFFLHSAVFLFLALMRLVNKTYLILRLYRPCCTVVGRLFLLYVEPMKTSIT